MFFECIDENVGRQCVLVELALVEPADEGMDDNGLFVV